MIDLSLLVAKFSFLAFLYLFVFWALTVVRSDNAFADQRQAASARSTVRIIDGPSGPSSYPIGDSALIGRDADSDIRLEDGAASAKHARLDRQGRHWVIEDLDSSNGTFIDGRRISGKRRLKPGDRIKIGRTVLTVEEAHSR
jgi:pSer/pThr/pTyr-binding forkhead associated (FHA) protein